MNTTQTTTAATETAAKAGDKATCKTCGGKKGLIMVGSGTTHRPFLICSDPNCSDDSLTKAEGN
jgi:hypothetical protein